MAQAIRGVSNNTKKISLSNYSLTTQIIIINILTALLGCIFLLLINYLLISNNNNLDKQINNIASDLNRITIFLSNNAIKRVPQFNVENCDINSSNAETECGEKFFSDPQLDPTLTQKYLLENYLYGIHKVKIYDDSWIRYADTEDIFISEDVVEIDNKQTLSNLDIFLSRKGSDEDKITENKDSLFNKYKENYLDLFNNLQKYFNNKFLSKIGVGKYKSEILLVQETIKKIANVSYLYKDENQDTILVSSAPIIKSGNTYGVAIVSGILKSENNESGLISFNLINLFIIIIFIMFFLSLLFSQSIVSPIKILSKILRSERDKSNKKNNKLTYPERNDEIGILSDDIHSMSEDLKNRISEIEGFAADVSHELKNPLASLKSSNELLVENKISNEKKYLLLRNMQKDIDRMNVLITDISRYTLTQVEIDEELFYNFDVVEFLNDFLEPYFTNTKNIKINFEFEKKISMINANKDKLAQVLSNLIDNSLSYSPQNSEILIEQKTTDKDVIISFFDQGSGINASLKNKIFERFYTDREVNQDKHSGLGLSIAKKIIESFSGSLKLNNVKSEKYFGACFSIILPLID
ncbi:MAG: HAMP domain-containing histidine kinase [Pelagibacteraceae bacterium]|jgi:two-component system sensor histidine kinase ChvG|nr:HAMP domain-containing histidine kinase [Pelagibacteraceae bacterium]HJO13316.1 HAMP domain-containing sensor histidine kinase [Alphaproteobacteria bacterium]MBO6465984.1 HAMP domain-containing histidine kinase [Pelagibacteraceae bacterium]MBO6467503.1 HAMP domain-containing histidine kinase [Pelagibacteraceae bacterium]MBO6469973.1 HAMP domain-containing histidine kinase [Pelagibacteraceae bacterium]